MNRRVEELVETLIVLQAQEEELEETLKPLLVVDGLDEWLKFLALDWLAQLIFPLLKSTDESQSDLLRDVVLQTGNSHVIHSGVEDVRVKIHLLFLGNLLLQVPIVRWLNVGSNPSGKLCHYHVERILVKLKLGKDVNKLIPCLLESHLNNVAKTFLFSDDLEHIGLVIIMDNHLLDRVYLLRLLWEDDLWSKVANSPDELFHDLDFWLGLLKLGSKYLTGHIKDFVCDAKIFVHLWH